ncbi:DUF1338 family protein [Aquihabitans sp. G128]|uniref:2-oxoadipate dioxygenase/decarboxylase family protein n=1 Tax=Aquihabitans sp. G128 TaxID=2849779 RepID=UPI001C226C71|nr:DUF1338 family protein [Aquihabitans sp. G128]QXC61011.1 DUF1338 family protein [Aquihabitans sp. G128]
MLEALVRVVLTGSVADDLLAEVAVEPEVSLPGVEVGSDATVPRATIAQALALVLFADLCERVPSAAGYVADQRAAGRRLVLDHAAVRTVAAPCGALPAGQEQVARLLRALGYEHRETYDLAALRMTGRSWAHVDHPEAVPQWFVSELHLDRLSPEVQVAAERLLATSLDPLTAADHELLDRLAADGSLPLADAAVLVPALARCFARLHAEPTDRDHDLFAQESAELAWIATEGTTGNHWTDRVPDVAAAAEAERLAGRPIKDTIEVSGSRRVRQTAHRATLVERRFHTVEGRSLVRTVPGSFFELIERAPRPDGSGLDLAFDAANATGIFAMTRAEGPSGILGGRRAGA